MAWTFDEPVAGERRERGQHPGRQGVGVDGHRERHPPQAAAQLGIRLGLQQ